jgi:hypothetical protein
MGNKDHGQSREYTAPFIRIRGRVSRGGHVRWSPCLRTEKGDPALLRPRDRDDRDPAGALAVSRGAYSIVLLDYRGEMLATAPAKPQFFSASQQWGTFVVRMPYQENVNFVRLVHGRERTLGELQVPTCRPYFTLLRPGDDSFIDSNGVLHLHWADHDSQLPLTYFVRYSHNGRDWLRPGVNLRTSDYYLDLREMPGGPHCVAQVLATNGYRTAVVYTRPFDVAVKPLEIMLGDTNSPVLFAQGYSRQDGPLTGNAISWLDQSGKTVGRGGVLDTRTLPPGAHSLRVRLQASTGIARTDLVGMFEGVTGRRLGPAML